MTIRTKLIVALVAFVVLLVFGNIINRRAISHVHEQVKHLTSISFPLSTLLGEIRAVGYRMHAEALSSALEGKEDGDDKPSRKAETAQPKGKGAADDDDDDRKAKPAQPQKQATGADEDERREGNEAESKSAGKASDHAADAGSGKSQFLAAKAKLPELLSQYVAGVEADGQALATALKEAAEKLSRTSEAFITAKRQRDENREAAEAKLEEAEGAFDEAIAEALEHEKEELVEASARTTQTVQRAATVSFSVIGVTLALVMLLVFFFSRVVARPLVYLTEAAVEIGKGNFSTQITSISTDEIGVLATAFTQMQSQLQQKTQENEGQTAELREQAQQVAKGVATLTAATNDIMASVSQVVAASSETAVSVTQTASTVEEVKQTAYVSSRKAQEVSDESRKTARISQDGQKAVEQAMVGMTRVREQIESIADSVIKLGEQSQTIGNIIATVNEIAEQSNLLAVNAAIEAANAGDAGKGFSVVAQEVKRLAEQSKRSTAQVRTILNEIQKAAQTAVLVTEQGTRSAEAGAKQAIEAGESIQTLTKSVTDSSLAVTQIAASSQQQVIGMDQVGRAIENIKKAALQNLEGIRQIETAAKSLQQVGVTLQVLVDRDLHTRRSVSESLKQV
ncbi:MAG: methyl-accepting chemotaxis protein [Deltaproteobacteria bacterium]|nr:methyl-accepting chemotaxis protein [Deltaproteobacteria bacterium]